MSKADSGASDAQALLQRGTETVLEGRAEPETSQIHFASAPLLLLEWVSRDCTWDGQAFTHQICTYRA